MTKKRTLCVFSIAALFIVCSVWYRVVVEHRFRTTVQTSYAQALSWLKHNQKENGLFYYIYDPRTGVYPDDNNAIRQLMASRLVAALSREDAAWVEIHKKNLSFIFTQWYKTDTGRDGTTIGYVDYAHKSKLGANAMLLRTLVESPFFDEYASQAQQLVHGILSVQHPDGSFSAWYIEPDYAYDEDRLLTFYSGEALVALAEYYKKTGDKTILAHAIQSQDFYMKRYVDELEQHYYPAYVPWHTLSLYELYHITGDQRYADAIVVLTDKLLELQDHTNDIGRFYNPDTPQYGAPHAASDGIYTEGLVYAYDIARERGDIRHIYTYRRAIQDAVQNLVSLQYTAGTIGREPDPWRLVGALKYTKKDGRIRTDTTQHTTDAYRAILNTYHAL